MKNDIICEPGNKVAQVCPFCGKVIFGIGPLVRHQKACKKKLCTQCCRPKTLCPDKDQNYLFECGEGFDSKEYWKQRNIK